jgi:iron complex transport system ATP-binding protein
VHDPEVLVLDEPSTALDFTAAMGLTTVMRELLAHGHTLVLVTHHPGEIPPEINRVILLEKGVVRVDAPKRKALRKELLSGLFDLPLQVTWSRGWCEVRPG